MACMSAVLFELCRVVTHHVCRIIFEANRDCVSVAVMSGCHMIDGLFIDAPLTEEWQADSVLAAMASSWRFCSQTRSWVVRH